MHIPVIEEQGWMTIALFADRAIYEVM